MKARHSTFTIMRRELSAYFTNPAAYIVSALFLLFSGILFFSTFFLNGRAELRSFFALLPILLSLFVPALTMRLFSEELKSGTFETLMTLPVTEAQVVLGKFFAAFIASAAMLVPTLFYAITAAVFGSPDIGPIIGGYIGALFLCASYSAIGIFSSGITKNQIIAFFTALAISVLLTLLGTLLVFFPAPLVRLFSWLGITRHFQSISRGIVDSRDALYFFALASLFILLTARRFAINWTKEKSLDFALALLVLLLLNVAGSRAFFRIDLTSQKLFSLSPASKELVRSLQEPLTVNVFFSSDLPAPYNSVEQYLNDLLIEYKNAGNRNFNYKFFDMNKAESQESARSYRLTQTQVQKVETTEVSAKAVWMSLAIVYGDNVKTFDSLDSSAGLEYKLTTAMSKMISASDALEALSDGLSLTLYPASDLKGFGIAGLDKIEGLAKSSAEELNKKFNGRIHFSVQEARGDEALALAEKYGIQSVNYDDPETNEQKTTALGLTLELGSEFRTIPLKLQNFFGWRLAGAENLSESISSSIESLLSKSVEIAYITGHEELSLYGNPYNQNELSAENFRNVLNDIYEFKEINLEDSDIPLNINCAVVNGPKTKFSDAELRKLDQFVMRGGNVLFCIEPLSESGGGNSAPAFAKNETGLERLLASYGLVPEANFVMDENAYIQNQGRGDSAKMNWAPIVGQKRLDRKNPITKYIPEMIFFLNGSIDASGAQSNPDAKVSLLARSSQKSWTVSENILLYPGYVFPPSDEEKIHEYNLAVLVEGKFKSAFAGIAPEAKQGQAGQDDGRGAENDSIAASEFLEKSILNSKILLVNSSQATTQQLVDNAGREPMAYFMRNAVDCLNGLEDYCEMRTKGISGSLLNRQRPALAAAFKLFNQFGLALLVALAGLLVWRMREKRRNEIRMRYNPDDEREMQKAKKPAQDGGANASDSPKGE